jgi:hypothetical protein
VQPPGTTLAEMNKSRQPAPLFGKPLAQSTATIVAEVTTTVLGSSSLPGTAASAIDVNNTVTETLRSAGGAEREIVPQSIHVDEITAESTNHVPQVHALALVLAFPQVHTHDRARVSAGACTLVIESVGACAGTCGRVSMHRD